MNAVLLCISFHSWDWTQLQRSSTFDVLDVSVQEFTWLYKDTHLWWTAHPNRRPSQLASNPVCFSYLLLACNTPGFGGESESKWYLVWVALNYFPVKLKSVRTLAKTCHYILNKHHRSPCTGSFFKASEELVFWLELASTHISFISSSITSSNCPY